MSNYRYILTREWLTGTRGTINWIMLNPSTADDVFDDPTIRKCIGFSKRWGFRRLVVTNLFAFRATDSAELVRLVSGDPAFAIGPENIHHLLREHFSAELTVAAWGDFVCATPYAKILEQGAPGAIPLFCIGTTKNGSPLHPSRAPYTRAPVLFRGASQ